MGDFSIINSNNHMQVITMNLIILDKNRFSKEGGAKLSLTGPRDCARRQVDMLVYVHLKLIITCYYLRRIKKC